MKRAYGSVFAVLLVALIVIAAGCDGTTSNNDPAAGQNSVVVGQSAATLEECANGGIKVEAGIDSNSNKTLDADEVDASKTQYVCNGEKGDKGDPGTDGAKGDTGATGDTGTTGDTGATGATGSDGLNALVELAEAGAGEDNCTFGGTKINVGLDANKNGALDSGEETSSKTICYLDWPAGQFTGIDSGYVGTDSCLSCHDGSVTGAADRTSFLKSGHPYKYTHTGGATPLGIPSLFTRPGATDNSYINTATLNGWMVADVDGLLDWSAVNYTVGGFGWKIRWGVKDTIMSGGTTSTGFVWSGPKAQFNIRDSSWSAYNGGKDKKYECAICHNTNGIVSTPGYFCETDGGTDAAPARTQPWANNPGMGPETHGGYYSSWTFDGVQCEACHGPGQGHANVNAPMGVLTIAGGVEICAKCHIRAENTTGVHAECGGDSNAKLLTNGAIASGDWIGHHEQYNELVGYDGDGAHASLTCTTCHDPHKRSTKVVDAVATHLGITDNTQSAEARGAIKVSCTSCHAGYTSSGTGSSMASLACIDCHMAEATKSASAKTGTWGRKGDVKTHIFRIDPTATGITRTNADGKTIATNYLTTAYACGRCHDSSAGGYYDLPKTSIDAKAANYHGN